MVTTEQLRRHTGRHPFLPFWITLSSGEKIVVHKQFRAVAMPTRLAVSEDGLKMRFIPLNEIVAHGLISIHFESNW